MTPNQSMQANESPVLEVAGLVKHFPAGGGRKVHAVNGVSLTVLPGQTVGLVGESGSGKSTIGRLVLRLIEPTAGRITFEGRDITHVGETAFRPLRAAMQIVFQDPWGALNPRLRARELVEEPLKLHTKMDAVARRKRADELAESVRLPAALLDRYPSELSGGQLQRVCIARSLATAPRLIVLDEPTSSLDLSVRAGILELLVELNAETKMAKLFITHDLGTLRLIADRIIVLYLGSVVEEGAAQDVFSRPQHPYTQALLSAHLPADPDVQLARVVLEGEVPSPIDLPAGCPFVSRCPVALPACGERVPQLEATTGPTHRAACWRIREGANLLKQAMPSAGRTERG